MILLLDMDSFFASVEQLDNPILYGKPVVVGGRDPKRSVVAAANYKARKYGIHSAMPIFMAKTLCPSLVIVPARIKIYKKYSRIVFSILEKYSPLIEKVSIDEAYIDLTGRLSVNGSAKNTAVKIQHHILKETGLSCSIGIAPIKFLAKIASNINKPNGIFEIEPHEIKAFIAELPIGKVPGVGKKTEKILTRMGVRSLNNIKKISILSLKKKLGVFAYRLVEMANGRDDSSVTIARERKSISSEYTMPFDTTDKRILERYLFRQAEDVGRQLRNIRLYSKSILLKVKYNDFSQKTYSKLLPFPVNSSKMIYFEAKKILKRANISSPLRLVGLGVSKLSKTRGYIQHSLFNFNKFELEKRWSKIEKLSEKINTMNKKYVIVKAQMLQIGIDFSKNRSYEHHSSLY